MSWKLKTQTQEISMVDRLVHYARTHNCTATDAAQDMRDVLKKSPALDDITAAQALRVLGTKANVQETVPAALYCFMKFDNYHAAIEAAIRAGGDTDTTAAIVGSLFGAKLGMKNIDKSLFVIEDFDKLVELDSQLYNRSKEVFFPRA